MTEASQRSILARLRTGRQLFASDSLYRNAVFLMASTVVMSMLGFVFWVFVAHLYAPADIGEASALISITTLLSNLSLLGLNSGIIRFLPSSKEPSRDINAAALAVAGVTVLAATAYVLVGTHIGGSISVLNGTWQKLAFVALLSAVSLNSLTDAVFIANRRGEYHTIGYATFGVVKLVLPLVLVPFAAVGIFGAYILAMIASLLVSYYLMMRGCNYHVIAKPNWAFLKHTRRYTSHNYLGVIISGLPSQLMPLLIIRQLGAAAAGYYSMAWTMANLLFVIPSALTQSLLAESSHDSNKKAEHIQRTVRLLVLLLVPAVLVAIVISPYLLSIFGQQYRQNGTVIFQILAFSTLFMAVNFVGNTVQNINRRTGGVVAVQLASTLATGVAALSLIRFGLPGIGLSFLIGALASNVMLGVLTLIRRPSPPSKAPFRINRSSLQLLLEPYGITSFTAQVLNNGSSNYTLLITSASHRYVLRIYRPGVVSDTGIEQELDFMSYLAAHGFPVPNIIASGYGQKLLHYSAGTIRMQYLLMEFIAGSHPTDYSLALLQDMAAQQASLHSLGVTYARTALHYRRHLPWSLRIRQVLLGTIAPAGFSQFDYDGSNLLIRGSQICTVLDFEGMRYGPLVGCLYFTLSKIYDQQRDPALLQHYLKYYEQKRRLRFLEKAVIRTALTVRYKKFVFLRLP